MSCVLNRAVVVCALTALTPAAWMQDSPKTVTPTSPPVAQPDMKSQLKALVQADVKSQSANPAPSAPPAALATTPGMATSDLLATPVPSPTPAPSPTDASAAATQPAVTMPAVQVNKSKITELNRELHEEDLLIARESKNTKSTELDNALNNPKISAPILGGESTSVRKTLATERVELMEFEKTLLESMRQAKTAKEKDDLKKQLDDVRQMRRDLETPR